MITFRGKIPITIYPAFWLFAALIGFINTFTFWGTLLWMIVIFVSVLFHELGHALTALLCGKSPRIELVAMGGLTYHQAEDLPWWKQFFIIFDGPLFGALLFFLATLLLFLPLPPLLFLLLKTTQLINLFWTILNLLPILPLDGGQLLRVVLEGFMGARGVRVALFVGMCAALGMSLVAFLLSWFLVGALFFLFAFQNYETWRRAKSFTSQDKDLSIKTLFEKAEDLLEAGRKEEAALLLEEVRGKTGSGLFYTLSTQYLAFLLYEKKLAKECYEMLLPLRKELSEEALVLLQRAAFDEKQYPLVVELAGECFKQVPTAETAFRNACASAFLGEVESAVGWLKTAQSEGADNLKELLAQEDFRLVREDPRFQEFLRSCS